VERNKSLMKVYEEGRGDKTEEPSKIFSEDLNWNWVKKENVVMIGEGFRSKGFSC
jgi:hypothetical protein